MPEKREIYEFEIPAELAGKRLDMAVLELAGGVDVVSRTRIQNIIKGGYLTVDGEVCLLPKTQVEEGMSIRADAPAPVMVERAEPEDIPLEVMYEDEAVLVINKPAGMVVHPGAGNWSGTVVNAVLGRENEMQDDEEFDPLRPGIVHRLDKDTSGCLVIAKTPAALRKLSRSFAAREVEKTYLAVVHGWPVPASSLIRTQIARHPADRRKMTVPRDGDCGREAVTFYRTERTGEIDGVKFALLSIRLHTGRTHQIRVHMSYLKHPLAGERVYASGRASAAPRQMLHAWRLTFPHPVTGETMSFEAPVPDDFRSLVERLK